MKYLFRALTDSDYDLELELGIITKKKYDKIYLKFKIAVYAYVISTIFFTLVLIKIYL